MRSALLLLLLFIASLTLATPITPISAENKDAHLISNTTSIAESANSPLNSRITKVSVSPRKARKFIFVDLEPGLKFSTCAPNHEDHRMCTLAYVQKNTWNGWCKLWVYDEECTLKGANDHVSRDWLANGWSLTGQLPLTVEVKIAKNWTEDHSKGVDILYGKHYTEPLHRPIYKSFAFRKRYDAKNPNEYYSVFRAPFLCYI
ncbi:hypothetical protein VTL71DRAFT_8784 [Oculimacula yallundae]|uniref:Uncharacterized protein n=1 Tax=Oculimacula yallundae TaxID=86028 RepID=A0ABR4D100_9HELO